MITLSVAIMSGSFDSERRSMVERLIREIHPEWISRLTMDFQVISDWWKSGCWPTAKRCWEHGVSIGATHHLVLQDDIAVCNDFLLAVHELIRAKPDNVIGLYANRKICEQAREQDARWVSIPDGTWGQAILMPTAKVANFLEWESKHIKPEFKWDDSRVALWAMNQGEQVLCPQPSLVEHASPEKSLLGHSRASRVARWFEKESPVGLDWAGGLVLSAPPAMPSSYKEFIL
mgnify:CR=1 FL=1|tara:strand:- start:405 stop:1100 length:696 start_codon:yes stop_codon:yes gene_type:complete